MYRGKRLCVDKYKSTL